MDVRTTAMLRSERRGVARKDDEILIFWGFSPLSSAFSVVDSFRPYVIAFISLSSLFRSASGEHSREVKS